MTIKVNTTPNIFCTFMPYPSLIFLVFVFQSKGEHVRVRPDYKVFTKDNRRTIMD